MLVKHSHAGIPVFFKMQSKPEEPSLVESVAVEVIMDFYRKYKMACFRCPYLGPFIINFGKLPVI